MIITLKEVVQSDNQINVKVEFKAGEHIVRELMTFYEPTTVQELVTKIKESAKRLFQSAQTTNTFKTYLNKQYNYDFQMDTLTEI